MEVCSRRVSSRRAATVFGICLKKRVIADWFGFDDTTSGDRSKGGLKYWGKYRHVLLTKLSRLSQDSEL